VCSEAKELAGFFREIVHPNYSVADCLDAGIAVHYGDMPAIVRTNVERLASNGGVNFVVSTSTLLQGVNLPARHIVIENPRKGRRNPMNRHDFLNLAGRAGRLTQEFSGTVWCLDADRWSSKPFEGSDRVGIRAASDQVWTDKMSELASALSSGNQDQFQGTAVGTLANALIARSASDEPYSEYLPDNLGAANRGAVQQLLANVQTDLPAKLILRHARTSLFDLESLFRELQSQPDQILSFQHPTREGFNEKFKLAIKLTARHLRHERNDSHRYWSALTLRWVQGETLRELIKHELGYKASERGSSLDDAEIARLIRELLRDINNIARFQLIRDLSAYADLASLCLHGNAWEEESEASKICSWLEFGTAEPLVVSLMDRGITRSTAITVSQRLKGTEVNELDEALATLDTVDMSKFHQFELEALSLV
jgi:hypothetical protein